MELVGNEAQQDELVNVKRDASRVSKYGVPFSRRSSRRTAPSNCAFPSKIPVDHFGATLTRREEAGLLTPQQKEQLRRTGTMHVCAAANASSPCATAVLSHSRTRAAHPLHLAVALVVLDIKRRCLCACARAMQQELRRLPSHPLRCRANGSMEVVRYLAEQGGEEAV